MSRVEMGDTSVLLAVAGAETSATVLAGATFLLATHPQVLAKLTDEVRNTFDSEASITLESVRSLSYIVAVVKESMRVFPAVPIALYRVTPPEGAYILGQYVPGGVSSLLLKVYLAKLTRK